MKKILSLVLALSMLLTMGFALAEETPDYDPDAIIYGAFNSDPLHFDPAFLSDAVSTSVCGQIYCSLMDRDLEGNVVPDVAESYEASEDGTVYTFHIRPGIKFHDGTPCDAYAVEWNWKRVCPCADGDPDTMPYANLIYGNVKSFEATDENTFVVTLGSPDSTFLTMQTTHNLIAVLVSPAAFEADPEGFAQHPVGCGPYKVTEWVPGQYVMLERYDDYHMGQVMNGVNNDYPVVQGGVLLIAIIGTGMNLIVNLMYGVLDPRVRY